MQMSETARKITIFNDSPEILGLMQDILQDDGYEVLTWTASTTAHELIKRESPDLVILDVVMEKPDSGWQLLQLLTLDPETKDIPVIICSADIRFLREHEELFRSKGCWTLAKPFDLDDLLSTVREALASRRQLAQEA
jgi:CheY-like chemotaxis protein